MKKPKKKILLLSGYDAASHQYWRERLTRGLHQYEWAQVSLPARYFFWRARGNALTFAYQHGEVLRQNYDCIIATSMVDLNSLRGFFPHFASIPSLVYFHENQFDYPSHSKAKTDSNLVNIQLISLYNILAADKVLFNSNHNLNSFSEGVRELIDKLPDGIPNDIFDKETDKFGLLPVPIVKPETISRDRVNRPIHIVWNHRWEYDKQPEVLFKALKKLKGKGVDFKLHILGQSFRQIPDCFEQGKRLFKQEIENWGFQPLQKYHEILSSSDIVVSTALHDFQGLSMQEAIARGCYPIAPDRVAYPEYMSNDHLYSLESHLDEATALFEKLVEVNNKIISSEDKLNTSDQHQGRITPIEDYFEASLLPKYQLEIDKLIQMKTKA